MHLAFTPGVEDVAGLDHGLLAHVLRVYNNPVTHSLVSIIQKIPTSWCVHNHPVTHSLG